MFWSRQPEVEIRAHPQPDTPTTDYRFYNDGRENDLPLRIAASIDRTLRQFRAASPPPTPQDILAVYSAVVQAFPADLGENGIGEDYISRGIDNQSWSSALIHCAGCEDTWASLWVQWTTTHYAQQAAKDREAEAWLPRGIDDPPE